MFIVRDGRCHRLSQNVGKEPILLVFSSTPGLKVVSLHIYADRPETIVSIFVGISRMYLLPLILFKSEAYGPCEVGLCLNLLLVSKILICFIHITVLASPAAYIHMQFLYEF
jgi:hypothetical protein